MICLVAMPTLACSCCPYFARVAMALNLLSANGSLSLFALSLCVSCYLSVLPVCVFVYKCILKLHFIRVIYFVYPFVLLALCWHSLISFAAREHNNNNIGIDNNNCNKESPWNILLLLH